MAKYSVKKPFTVVVAVVIIIVLGFVAFSSMTPDLLPNMDLPYVVVMTTYPGATPEKVETAVTKPLEQTMSTLDHIESVSSTSSENVSTLVLEFAEDVNLDAATVDILQKISQIQDYWDDSVSTPYILKLNPSMLPVMVAAVEVEGMDTPALSAYVNDVLLNQLEGTAGVASISATGLIEKTLKVTISQQRIDAVNEQVRKAIDGEFTESEQELADAKAEAEDKLGDIKSGKAEMEEGRTTLTDKTAAGEAEISKNQAKIIEGKIQIQGQITSLEAQLKSLDENAKSLTELQATIAQLEAAQKQLTGGIAQLETLQATIAQLEAAWNNLAPSIEPAIAAIDAMPGISAEEKEALKAQIPFYAEYLQTKAALAEIDTQLAALGTSRETLQETVDGYKNDLATVTKNLEKIDDNLLAQKMTRKDIAGAVKEIEAGKKKIAQGLAELKTMLAGLEDGSVKLTDALATLSRTKTEAILDLSDATAQMVVGETMLNSALDQIDDGLEKIEDAKTDAYDKADMHDTITMESVSAILTAQNFTMPVGYVQEEGMDVLVRVGDAFKSVDEMRGLMLFNLQMEGMEPIYLSDVADITIADNSGEVYAKIDNNDGVLLSFNKQSAYATAEVSDNLNAKFAELSAQTQGLRFVNMMDQGDYIYLVVNSILQNLLLGAVFAVLILFLFLWDLKPTFITLCSIPLSVMFAIVLMYFSGITLNIISLSGLAVAVGMLVDNSVVVIENIYRLRSLGATPMQAAVTGATQVSGAIASSTLTTVCVFFPIVFVQGITRQLFTDMALTMAYALIASLIVALTLVPAMSAGMLKNIKKQKPGILTRLLAAYKRSAQWTLHHKAPVLIAVTALLAVSVITGFSRGFTFMPAMNMPQLSITMEMPEDTEMEQTTETADIVLARLQEMPEVETAAAMMSSGGGFGLLGGGGGGSGTGTTVTMYAQLTEKAGLDSGAVATKIVGMFDDLPCTITADASAMGGGMSILGGSGVSLNLYSENLDDLQLAAKQVAKAMETVEGAKEVEDGIGDTSPEIRFVVDKEKAMNEGLTVAQVFQQLSAEMTTEKNSTTVPYEGEDLQVIIDTGKEASLTPSHIKSFMLTTTNKDGEEKKVPITDIAEITEAETATSISRVDQRRYITVSAALEDGYNVSLVSAEAEKVMANEKLPAGVTYKFTGENETIMDALKDLVSMLLLGVLLVYLIMVAQFQSLKSPFIVMFTIPLAFTGGLFALVITGKEFSIIAMIGFIMLVGIIVNNGIVLVDYINQLRLEGVERREAIIEAGVTRMRPILMTSITTILGLSVTALGTGMGSAMMQPIAIVCIGGLTYATLLTLYVIPIMYDLFARKNMRKVTDEDLIVEDNGLFETSAELLGEMGATQEALEPQQEPQTGEDGENIQ